MSRSVKIAPSILSADFSKLGEEIKAIDKAGADFIHIDVMDGHFVPNITMGAPVVKALRKCSEKVFDTHLMISPVDPFLDDFIAAGSDIVTIHPEAGSHYHRTIQYIKSKGVKAGVVLNPGTEPSVLDYVMDMVDLILVMSVNPGFGGQTFIASQLDKIRIIREKIQATGREIDLQVDGGINFETAPLAIEAGANVLVAGTATFTGGPSQYAANIARLRGE